MRYFISYDKRNILIYIIAEISLDINRFLYCELGSDPMLNYGFQSRIDICGSVMAITPKDL